VPICQPDDVTIRPTWDHDVRFAYPELAAMTSIEEHFETLASGPRLANRVCVIDGAIQLTGAEMTDRVMRLAGGLTALGVGRGDAVCFQTPSWWETIALYRACWRIGAIASPVHHLASTADVARIIDEIGPAATFAAAGSPLSERTDLEVVEVRGSGGFEELLKVAPHESIDADPADAAVVLFTSGSTGGPKGVVHTHRALLYKATTLMKIHGVDHRDTVLMPAPMAHISGLSNAVMLPGAGGLCSMLMDKWVPTRAIELVEEHGVTFMTGPPTFFQTMMSAPNFTTEAMRSLRLISCGGAGVTPAFVTAASAGFGATVKRTYGSTEAPVVTTWHVGDPPVRAADSDGRAAGPIQLRIVDPDSFDERPVGISGELVIRGPELFVGYTNPDRTAEAVRDDWFRTGDLATIDAEGWLRIVGRIKDIIIRGGENISAGELEGILEAHPSVHQAVAIGFPDERLGERVCAFVVLQPGAGVEAGFDLPECQRWFSERGVTKFMWPERIEVLEQLPVLASSGKADRATLRALAAS